MSENKRRGRKILGAIVIAIIIIGFLLYFTVFRPRAPRIVTTLLELRHLHFQSTPIPMLKASLGLAISIYNPNFVTFSYHATTALAYYRGNLVGSTRIKPGTIPGRHTRIIGTIVNVGLRRVATSQDFLLDVAALRLKFKAFAVTTGSANVIGLAIHATAYTGCEVEILLPDGGSVSSCSSRVEI